MKISKRKIRWMSIGFALAMLTGAPAIADDTELLLINPNPANAPKPNVLFILDTSGSMNTTQTTAAPYDSTLIYLGICDPSKYYWTEVDVLPDCSTSNNIIDADKMVCDYATSQLNGIGSFTNTLVQYRKGGKSGTSPGPSRWQMLAPGYSKAYVECQADSGVHGDGRLAFLWAANGTNLTDPFTSNPSAELSWGSSPRNIGYTVYTGNYLNWKASPATVTLSRSAIMKEVTKKVLSSVSNLNVGLMRFDGNDGGPVILDMTDLDTNRQAVLDAIDSLPAGGNTPLSEVLYESALYWRGMPAHFGQASFTLLTDPAALLPATEIYEHPDWDVCAKNFNVLLTDGAPTQDFDTTGLIANLPNSASVLGYSGCDGPVLLNGGECLDDIAEYLSLEDVDSVENGDQLVTTHTIGFTINLPILSETASNSGGQYFLADDVESLTKTLLSIIANINDLSLSFAAPAVSVNTFNRTRNLNDMYITTFGAKTRAHWPGNLKRYRISGGVVVDVNGVPAVDPNTGFFVDTATSYWTTGGADGDDVRLGGAAQQLPDPSVRNVYTNNTGNDLTAAVNAVSTSNMGAFVDADFGLTGAFGEPSMDEIIRWARGADLLDEDNNPSTLVRRIMGDPLHSQPAAVVYGGTALAPEAVIFTATNDGYLHAIDGATGVELWSFIPKEVLSDLMRLYFDPVSRYKHYGLDGNIVSVAKDVDGDGIIEPGDGDFVQLVFGMRRGGSTFYSLDVTDKNSPQLLWTVTDPTFGESWSTPVVARIDISGATQNVDKAVVVIGGGYDNVHDTTTHPASPDAAGASIHMLDLRTGPELWRTSSNAGADLRLANMTRSMHNQVRVIDLNGDRLADRMYASDAGGQIWRFDIFNGQAASTLVTGGVIARIGAEGIATPTAAETRRFYNAPDVSLITDRLQQRRFLAVSIGTGYRAHPFDLSAADRFVSIRDGDVFNPLTQAMYDSYPIITDADLVEVSGQTQTVITANDGGWKFTLPGNEKIVADSLTFDDQILFVSFTPDTVAAATCATGKGTNFLYRVSAINGDPVVPNIATLNPSTSDDERRETLAQGGIAPSPAILFPTPGPACTGDACSPEPIVCVGAECGPSGLDNNPVRTLWTQDGIE